MPPLIWNLHRWLYFQHILSSNLEFDYYIRAHNIKNDDNGYQFEWLEQIEAKHKCVDVLWIAAVYGKLASETVIAIFSIVEA